LTRYYAGCYALYRARSRSPYRTLAVHGLPESVYNTPYHGITRRHFRNPARKAYSVTLLDVFVRTQQNNAHVVLFKVKSHTENSRFHKLQKLTAHCVVKTKNPCDTISNLYNTANFRDFQLVGIPLYLLFYNRTNFFRSETHTLSPILIFG
jgi:hypothetical protein